ncbi:hypothetical protein DFH11DRAFT_1742495 [Phellopilus nigrolimitatus]|nr:hypothetical protein DFH11DRAFT_1742495 [Phellopilus nigrolimitatus]
MHLWSALFPGGKGSYTFDRKFQSVWFLLAVSGFKSISTRIPFAHVRMRLKCESACSTYLVKAANHPQQKNTTGIGEDKSSQDVSQKEKGKKKRAKRKHFATWHAALPDELCAYIAVMHSCFARLPRARHCIAFCMHVVLVARKANCIVNKSSDTDAMATEVNFESAWDRMPPSTSNPIAPPILGNPDSSKIPFISDTALKIARKKGFCVSHENPSGGENPTCELVFSPIGNKSPEKEIRTKERIAWARVEELVIKFLGNQPDVECEDAL